MKRLFQLIIFMLVFQSASSYAGYTRQGPGGDWVSTDDNGNTTYYNQGADPSSYWSNTQRNSVYTPTFPASYPSQQNSNWGFGNNLGAAYQLGSQIGAANAPSMVGPQAVNDMFMQQQQMGMIYAMNMAAQQAQQEAQQREYERQKSTQAENQRQLGILTLNKIEVVQKYPELNDPNSEVTKQYLNAVKRHPEYLSDPQGPILAMQDMEAEQKRIEIQSTRNFVASYYKGVTEMNNFSEKVGKMIAGKSFEKDFTLADVDKIKHSIVSAISIFENIKPSSSSTQQKELLDRTLQALKIYDQAFNELVENRKRLLKGNLLDSLNARIQWGGVKPEVSANIGVAARMISVCLRQFESLVASRSDAFSAEEIKYYLY